MSYVCTKCKEFFTDKETLNVRTGNHLNIKSLTSSSGCTKSLKSNIQKKKQEFEKNQCLECNGLFLPTANMEHHRKIHSCSECAYSTTEIAALKV